MFKVAMGDFFSPLGYGPCYDTSDDPKYMCGSITDNFVWCFNIQLMNNVHCET